ncbi:MAG: acetyl-CoA carboxylase biotin carboxyl carrier protein subunit [Micropruina sp.]|nr:acetyl-CoA carboxylase biotin carboxyl carrier protein subunit [Micropruina sp.]
MRRYTLTVNDSTKVIEVEAVGTNLFRVLVDGQLVDVTLDDHRDLAHSAVTPAITPRTVPTERPPVTPTAAAAGTAAAPTPAVRAVGASGGGAGLNRMTAPMPGVVLRIDGAVGAQVHRGDTVLVLEAMKMKNELKAPRDGRIAEIYVTEGQQVQYGATLVRFEEH